MAEDRRRFGTSGNWRTTVLDPGVLYSIVCEGGCRFMVEWVREEGKASENRQRKRGAEEAGKVEVAPPGVVSRSKLRRFRAALIGSTQELPKRRRLRR